jgi:hypothetical protein
MPASAGSHRHSFHALVASPGAGWLIWNQRHLLHALREYEIFYNTHRPHQGIANARPLAPLPEPIADPDRLARLNIHRRDRLGGVLHEYEHAA